MCTVSIIPIRNNDRRGVRVVFNRDEQRDRPPAAPPRWRDVPVAGLSLRAIWPADTHAGGTWIAAAESGLILALVNRNLDSRPKLPDGLISRGRIIPALITAPTAHAAINAISSLNIDSFAPFRLLALHPRGGEVLEASWDRHRLSVLTHDGPPLCIASSGLGDSLVQERVRLFKETVGALAGPVYQDRFHAHVWPSRPHVSVLMTREDARTVSVTTLQAVDEEDGVRICMAYRAVPDDVQPRVRTAV
ncbi:MAG: NRDE family protein [Planctomycetes bacterium]|nr:NRDE family protein [Planctomycetota bacterium]